MLLPNRKVIVVRLCRDKFVETDGTTTERVIVLDFPQAEVVASWGPLLESIRAVTNTENRTTEFQWRVALQVSFDGRTWGPASPTGVSPFQVANGMLINAPLTNQDLFAAPYLRLVITAKNGQGANRESGSVGADVHFVFRS